MSNIRDFKNKNTVFTGTDGIKLPIGTDAQRVDTTALLRFNSDSDYMEYYDGTSWTPVIPLPTLSTASPTVVEPSTTETITVTGNNFDATAIVSVVGSTDGVETSANSTTYVSKTELTASITFSSQLQDYKVKVVAAAGAGISAVDLISASSAPTWNTASGATLSTVYINSPISTSVSASSDTTVSYSEVGSTLTGTDTPENEMNLSLNSSTGAITGTSPSPAGSSVTYNFTLRATDEELQSTDRSFNIVVQRFTGGTQSAASMKELAQGILTATNTSVTTGGSLTLNGNTAGNYEYYKTSGTTTISSFSSGTYFSGNQDTYGSYMVFDGDTTLNSGVTFQPSQRKLYQCWYVNGNLTINGTISMKSRGANHNGGGNSSGYVGEFTVPIDGTYTIASNAAGNGGNGRPQGSPGGSGASGTCFSGGPGGGGGDNGTGQPGTPRGGQGGHGQGYNSSGGAGNPGGVNRGSGHVGPSGTGGTVVIMCTGNVSGSGSIVCRAYDGHGSGGHRGGGGSGGGVIKVLAGGTASISTDVNGGTGGVASSGQGQPGASGTANIYQGVSF